MLENIYVDAGNITSVRIVAMNIKLKEAQFSACDRQNYVVLLVLIRLLPPCVLVTLQTLLYRGHDESFCQKCAVLFRSEVTIVLPIDI